MNTIFLVVPPSISMGVNPQTGYVIALFIGLVFLACLFYTLVKPDRY